MGLVGKATEYGIDVHGIARSPHSWLRKLRLWIRLNLFSTGFRGDNILGYKVAHFGGKTLYFLYREIFARQCYLFQARTTRPLIFDCGANIGMAVLYFKWLYPESEIRAFEPEPHVFQALQQNVARNHLTNVSVHNVALWEQDGHLDIFVSGNAPGSLMTSANPARQGGTPVNVPCARLSSFIDREVDFLKLDIEGAELQVVGELAQSGKLALVRQMVIEYHHNIPGQRGTISTLLRILEEAGFTCQISASSPRLVGPAHFQDILIGAFRPSSP